MRNGEWEVRIEGDENGGGEMEGRIESEVGREGIKQERGEGCRREVGEERKEGKRSGGRAPR